MIDIRKIKEEQKGLYQSIIDGVIVAKNSGDLKILIDRVKSSEWIEKDREMFLWGLIQGTLMQYKKDVSVEELKTIFRKI